MLSKGAGTTTPEQGLFRRDQSPSYIRCDRQRLFNPYEIAIASRQTRNSRLVTGSWRLHLLWRRQEKLVGREQ